ncbi:hypothetical protein E3N88_05156 [Mikania micrantha]|uniref:Uncharacterized protein n=1 Tax=Mikania micrantha TaxID=192012 RepID=A0A5N6PYL9_9ASTR|nr:hypothetical protein E3N88_05156 [Mikania micrantha]
MVSACEWTTNRELAFCFGLCVEYKTTHNAHLGGVHVADVATARQRCALKWRREEGACRSVQRAPRIESCISGDFFKPVSHGSHMFSSFASGFSPLKHKPLESLIDTERAKHQTPEDLAAIWDDVSYCNLVVDTFM